MTVVASKRTISHSEISTASDCQAKHAFAYTGHLTDGTVLKPRSDHANLRAGRAWGRAVAALHTPDSGEGAAAIAPPQATGLLPLTSAGAAPPANGDRPLTGVTLNDVLHGPALTGATLLHTYRRALNALADELDQQVADIRRKRAAMVSDDAVDLWMRGVTDEHADLFVRLAAVLWDYARWTPPLTLHSPEIEMRVPLPSRTGRRVSNRFLFHGYLDGLTRLDGRLWVVEYKFRDRLTEFAQLVLGRQYRRYIWAAEQVLGEPVAGILVDERLSEPPKPARWVKGRRKDQGMVPSHAKDQLTTRELYEFICAAAGEEINQETADHLGARRWQMRHPVQFRRSEIAEAGRELVSSAQLIAQLDSGVLFPVRNAVPRLCGGCQFQRVCNATHDRELIDLNYIRQTPKRLRGPQEEPTVTQPNPEPERIAA